jgi:hypothetical protein
MVVARLLGGDLAIGDDDHPVAGLYQAGRGAVHRHVVRPARGLDGVGGEAPAGIDVEHVDLLMRQDAGGVEQVAVDGDRALIVHVRASHRGAVELRLHHREQHGRRSFNRASLILSPHISHEPLCCNAASAARRTNARRGASQRPAYELFSSFLRWAFGPRQDGGVARRKAQNRLVPCGTRAPLGAPHALKSEHAHLRGLSTAPSRAFRCRIWPGGQFSS